MFLVTKILLWLSFAGVVDVYAADSKSLMLSVTGYEEEAIKLGFKRFGDIQLLPSTVKQFPNSNTFVRLPDNQYVGKQVLVILPEKMSTDQYIEALIKIHTLKTHGAARIVLAAEESVKDLKVFDAHNNLIELDHVELFLKAGISVYQNLKKASFSRTDLIVSPEKLAHPKYVRVKGSVVMGFDHPDLRDSLAKELNLPVIQKSIDYWNESFESFEPRNVILVAANPIPVNDSLLKNLSIIQKLKKNDHRIMLVTPYFPYARSDKIDQSGVTITGRLMADLLETAGVGSIAMVHLHSPQAEGFFRIPTVHISGRETVQNYLKSLNVDMFISPDEGAQKETTSYAYALQKELAIINKRRDPTTSKLSIVGISGADVKRRNVVLIDDETASGETFSQGGNFVKELGAQKVYAVAIHLAGDGQKVLSNPNVSELIITNTYPISSQDSRLKILDIAPEIARAIKPIIDVISENSDCGVIFSN